MLTNDNVGSSSSVMVPVLSTVVPPMVALTGLLSLATTVSSGSSTSSPVTATLNFSLTDPGAKVSRPGSGNAV